MDTDAEWFDELTLIEQGFLIYMAAWGFGMAVMLAIKSLEDDQGQNEN